MSLVQKVEGIAIPQVSEILAVANESTYEEQGNYGKLTTPDNVVVYFLKAEAPNIDSAPDKFTIRKGSKPETSGSLFIVPLNSSSFTKF